MKGLFVSMFLHCFLDEEKLCKIRLYSIWLGQSRRWFREKLRCEEAGDYRGVEEYAALEKECLDEANRWKNVI